MNNREKLEEAGIIKKDAELSPEQIEVIEKLSQQEVEALISVNKKLAVAPEASVEEKIILVHMD